MQFGDRVWETTTTSGTGPVSMGGAVAAYRTFASTFVSGTQTAYTLVDGNNWEVGYGTLTSGSPWTMSRDIVLSSSNAGALITLSGGTTQVFCDAPAAQTDWPTPYLPVGNCESVAHLRCWVSW